MKKTSSNNERKNAVQEELDPMKSRKDEMKGVFEDVI